MKAVMAFESSENPRCSLTEPAYLMKYTLIEPSNVRFEILCEDSPDEIVNGTYSQGDVRTFSSADGKETSQSLVRRLNLRIT